MSQEEYASDEEMGDEGDSYMDDSDDGCMGGSDDDYDAGAEVLGTKKARKQRSERREAAMQLTAL